MLSETLAAYFAVERLDDPILGQLTKLAEVLYSSLPVRRDSVPVT